MAKEYVKQAVSSDGTRTIQPKEDFLGRDFFFNGSGCLY